MKLDIKNYSPPTNEDMQNWQTSMRAAFFDGVSAADMREIVKGLVAKAKAGDIASIRILLAYGIGSTSVKVHADNATIVAGERTPAPCPPTLTLPGTAARVEAMAERAANGQALFSRKDRKIAEGS